MLKYAQKRDSGVYECQINTEPKMSLSYTLNVIGKSLYIDATLRSMWVVWEEPWILMIAAAISFWEILCGKILGTF